MNIRIKEVVTLRDLKYFIRFPHALYRGNPNWVPPLFLDEYRTLRRDKNPSFENCEAKYWLAYEGNRVVGRIAGIINRLHVKKWGQRYARFGWVDFADDAAVSEALFGVVENWAKQAGMTAVHGPLGFTPLDPEGMLIDGFEELGTVATIYNHPYYPGHVEGLGYSKDVDWVEYELTDSAGADDIFADITGVVMRRYKLKMANIRDKKELLAHAGEAFRLLNDEYQDLYAFVPLTERQIERYIRQYFKYINTDFVSAVLDEKGRMVAFGVSIPSLSRALQRARGRLLPFGFIHFSRALRKNDRVDLCLMAVRSEYRGKGVNAVLIHKMYRLYKKYGIVKVESNPELETNHNVQEQWKHFQRRRHKRRRCFIKHLA